MNEFSEHHDESGDAMMVGVLVCLLGFLLTDFLMGRVFGAVTFASLDHRGQLVCLLMALLIGMFVLGPLLYWTVSSRDFLQPKRRVRSGRVLKGLGYLLPLRVSEKFVNDVDDLVALDLERRCQSVCSRLRTLCVRVLFYWQAVLLSWKLLGIGVVASFLR